MKNKCIKEEGWWVFKCKVLSHNYKAYAISKFMLSSRTFHLHSKCVNCGVTKDTPFVEKDELLIMGISADVIENITSWYLLDD